MPAQNSITQAKLNRSLRVAWISFFPVEWMPEAPESLRQMPRWHPAPWQRVLLEELKREPSLKLEVFSVRKHFPRNCQFEHDGVRFHCVKVPGGLRSLSLFWWETVLLRRRLRLLRPDLVHAWGSERGAALVASRLPYPYVVTMQGLLGWIKEYVKPDLYGRLDTYLERISLRRASFATAESSFAVQWLRQHYPHLEVRQAEHAPGWLFQRLKRKPQTQPTQFLYIGMVSYLKGTDLLVKALDRLRHELDFRLTLVAGPATEYLAQLKAETSPALWERITIHNTLTSPEIADLMARATVMLFPTRVDNSPNSVKEAVVAGLPVVAAAVGGVLDYVIPEKNGLRFPAGDFEAFLAAVRAAAAHPLFGAGQVEPQTLDKMRDYLSPRTMGRSFLEVYHRVRR